MCVSLAQTSPGLPPLTIDVFPPPTREALSRPYERARAQPDDVDAVGTLAKTLHAWDQWNAAHDAYRRAQALAPRVFAWHYLDAVVLQRLARHDEAVTRLERALQLSSEYLPARVKLAESLVESGDLDRAASLFAALQGDPTSEPAAALGLGRIAAARGDHAAAARHLERAVALFPEWGAAYYRLALSYRALGRRDDAKRALERSTEYGPRWPALHDPTLAAVTALRDDAETDLRRGLRLADEGDLEGAIAAHEAALARDPSIARAHVNLISLYGRTHAWDKAERHYRAVLALGFNLDEAHYDYGVLLGMQEKWALAADAYRQSIAANPGHALAHNNLGQIDERDRRIETAAAEYRQAVDSQPTLRLARFNLGRMLIALGRHDDAIVELAKLTEPRDAEAPRYLFALATAHVRAGHTADGIRWATDAKQLALQHGQQELAAAIEQELARLK